MMTDFSVLSAILDAYPYQIVFCDRNHIIRYMNKDARERYAGKISVGDSIFGCHNQSSCQPFTPKTVTHALYWVKMP